MAIIKSKCFKQEIIFMKATLNDLKNKLNDPSITRYKYNLLKQRIENQESRICGFIDGYNMCSKEKKEQEVLEFSN